MTTMNSVIIFGRLINFFACVQMISSDWHVINIQIFGFFLQVKHKLLEKKCEHAFHDRSISIVHHFECLHLVYVWKLIWITFSLLDDMKFCDWFETRRFMVEDPSYDFTVYERRFLEIWLDDKWLKPRLPSNANNLIFSLGDINNDGLPDLYISEGFIYLNQGNGSFVRDQSLEVNIHPGRGVLDDFNGDRFLNSKLQNCIFHFERCWSCYLSRPYNQVIYQRRKWFYFWDIFCDSEKCCA